jgi:hypothetical protein
MHLKASDVVAVCSAVVAFASAVSAPALEAVFPGHGTYLAGVVSLSSLAAGVIIRVVNNPKDAPAKSIVEGAPVVPPTTTVVEPSTAVVGLNVSTTSTDPIKAPQT